MAVALQRKTNMRDFVHELGRRAAVGAVALPIVALLLWLGGGASALLFALGGAIATFEYYRLTPARDANVRWIGIVAGGVLPAVPLVVHAAWSAVVLAIVATTSVVTWASMLVFGPREEAPGRAGHVLAGIVFVASGLVALAVLRARTDGLAWATIVLVAAWSNDTGAFIGGKLLGRHSLLPSVSPGKTREGLATGALAGIGGAAATHLWFPEISLRDAVIVGFIAAVFGPIGDLCKSMLKRAAGAKDSGRLFRAHGGMLDRIDAVLIDALAVVGYLAITQA